jgi:hypothetical protein
MPGARLSAFANQIIEEAWDTGCPRLKKINQFSYNLPLLNPSDVLTGRKILARACLAGLNMTALGLRLGIEPATE